VLLNLLLNAGRATGGSGCVRIEARTDGADWVELEVEDDGPGIPPADLGRNVDPFFSGTGGSGLGVAVSYGIIRAHGGTFSARNVPGSGARFTIRLPRARPPGREKARADGLPAGGRRLSEEP
jgi:signal transduction histidine kinase